MQHASEQAAAERATNATDSYAEKVADAQSKGFATVVFDDAAELCDDGDAVGCVASDQPQVIHLDAERFEHDSMDDWGRRLITLHELAHVLQFLNPDQSAEAVEAFDDDAEFMADCYALTVMNEDSLDRRVWTSSWAYWDVSYGYGRVCDDAQREVIRTWLDAVTVRPFTIAQ